MGMDTFWSQTKIEPFLSSDEENLLGKHKSRMGVLVRMKKSGER